MAGEEDEDVELRDLVAQTLESQGVLGSIRAQLRASVVLALEEQESKTKPHSLVNKRLTSFLKTKDGQLTVGLVREFLEFFELDFTCSVFDPETNVLKTYQGRDQLAADVGLNENTDTPLLLDLLKSSRNANPPPPPVPNLVPPSSVPSAVPVTTIPLAPPSTATPITSIPSLKQLELAAMTKSPTPPQKKDASFLDSKFLASEAGLTGRSGDPLARLLDSDSQNGDPLARLLDSDSRSSDPLARLLDSDSRSSDPLARLLDSNSRKPMDAKTSSGVEGEDESDNEDGSTANLKYETTDHSLSQASAGDFDYSEQIQ